MRLRDIKGHITVRPWVLPLPVDGMWFIGTNLQNMKHGWNEPATAKFIRDTLKRGQTFVDIGANYGYYSVLAAKCGAKVVSYEPDETSFKRLTRNLKLNGVKSELHKAAVSDHEGTIDFYVFKKGAGTNSTLASVQNVPSVKRTVHATTCDVTYDLCKIDVEGAELKALAGLKYHGLIICELNPIAHERQGSSAQEYINSIRALGWNIEDIEEGSMSDADLIAKAKHNTVLNMLLRPSD
jgi:FkbM family methyltransferase